MKDMEAVLNLFLNKLSSLLTFHNLSRLFNVHADIEAVSGSS